MNCIIEIAQKRRKEPYITPEDISDALIKYRDASLVRIDLLEILGNQTRYGVEDASLCAFIAWKGIEKTFLPK